MVDDGILFSYKDDAAYAESVRRVRTKLCAVRQHYHVLTDRITGNMRRFAVAIFDDRGAADIDVCLLGNTLYILAMRLAELKWFATAKQDAEFGACRASIIADLPFESGYGALGVNRGSGPSRFTRDQASGHAAAMKAYMRNFERPTPEQIAACKLAFAFFAMTIAEAARFPEIEHMMYRGGIDAPAVIPALQRWVIDSSVRDDQFPSARIAIVGVHEKRSGKIWKDLVANLTSNPHLAPTVDDLADNSQGTRAFLNKLGVFAGTDQLSRAAAKRGDKSGFDSGYEFLLDAFFLSRLDPQCIVKARQEFDKLLTYGRPVSAQALAGLST